MVTLDVAALSFQEVNRRLKELAAQGDRILVLNPRGLHNFAVGLQSKVEIIVQGSLGVYVGGFMEGPEITVRGDTGWYTGDNMIAGRIVVEGNTGSNPAPSMIGGEIIIRGHTGSRAGYGLKGGNVVVYGNVGLETGKMMLGGRIVVLGNAGARIGESMYGGVIHVLGRVESVGGNVCVGSPEGPEAVQLAALLASLGITASPGDFTTFTPRPGKHTYVLFRPGHRPVPKAGAAAGTARGGGD